MKEKSYQYALDYLYGLEKFGMIFGLTQMQRILDAIGNPHREVQTIHIAGTNGKGSTAMAILFFKQRMVDLAVLEVGLGGKLDSTNVVDPLVSVITNIAKDHE